jgi:hypothetical protein
MDLVPMIRDRIVKSRDLFVIFSPKGLQERIFGHLLTCSFILLFLSL